MTPRGERAKAEVGVEPPVPGPENFDVRFLNGKASNGWDDLLRQVPENVKKMVKILSENPCPAMRSQRQHRLKGKYAHKVVDGRSFDQWQYEITAGGRVWYVVDEDIKTVWITLAGTGHPKATD